MRSLALVGPWPPPYGGISLHMKRLALRLRALGTGVRVYDDTGAHRQEGVWPLRGRWVNGFLFSAQPQIVHYHSHSWGTRARLSLMTLRGKKVVFTVHSLRRSPRVPAIKRPEFLHMLRRARFIAVNQDIAASLEDMGAKRIAVIPPYISPPSWGEPHPEVRAFAEGHRPVLAASALLFKAWNGGDMYGLFSTLEALSLLRGDMPEVGLVLYISQKGNEAMFRDFLARIGTLGLEGNILLRMAAPEEFHTCLSVADAFLRPSFADSFGMSTAEALEMGVRCVASDAVPRQKGVSLFRAGDPRDLARATKEALARRPVRVSLDAFGEVWEFYNKLFAE